MILDTGHMAKDCDREKDQIGCYNCKEIGHLAKVTWIKFIDFL